MDAKVIVVGGGYGGIAVTRALDEAADVVLVEPRDRFVHNVAALRGLVDAEWTERMFLPYDRLLRRGTVRRDRVTAVDGTTVCLAGGDELHADYVVLATGSDYPFPAKVAVAETEVAKKEFTAARSELERARSVLLVGAGPVGLELAGEIRGAWPDKHVTIVDRNPELLPGDLPDALRHEVRRQLDEQRIALRLGESLEALPPSEPGVHAPFRVRIDSGSEIAADLWFRCHGVEPVSDYLTGSSRVARDGHGAVAVNRYLQVAGHDRVFAVGDVTAIAETKMAKRAEQHAAVVAANIRTLIAGGTQLSPYSPAAESLSLPLGPAGGVTYRDDVGTLGAEQTAALKGADLRTDVYRAALGLD